jgi:hypothetical protein
MDNETMNLLQTVCAAGGARPAFNGDQNARLEQLVKDGLLDVANPTNTRRRLYRPTKKGVAMVAQASALRKIG